jgi:hypothetical protein
MSTTREVSPVASRSIINCNKLGTRLFLVAPYKGNARMAYLQKLYKIAIFAKLNDSLIFFLDIKIKCIIQCHGITALKISANEAHLFATYLEGHRFPFLSRASALHHPTRSNIANLILEVIVE